VTSQPQLQRQGLPSDKCACIRAEASLLMALACTQPCRKAPQITDRPSCAPTQPSSGCLSEGRCLARHHKQKPRCGHGPQQGMNAYLNPCTAWCKTPKPMLANHARHRATVTALTRKLIIIKIINRSACTAQRRRHLTARRDVHQQAPAALRCCQALDLMLMPKQCSPPAPPLPSRVLSKHLHKMCHAHVASG